MIKARVRKPIPWKKILAPTLAAVAAIGVSVPVTIAIMKKNQSVPVAAQYTITFEDCFPEKSTTTQSKVNNGEKAVMPLPEHRDGYGFLGWKTVKDNPTAEYFDFMNTPITTNLKLYGYWLTKETSADYFQIVDTTKGSFIRLSDKIWDDPIDDIVVPGKVGDKTIVGVDEWGFDSCPARSISLPNSIKYFSEGAFGGCNNLRILNMPEQLKTIGKDCFYNCYKLADITLPEGLEAIGEEAFKGCEDREEPEGSPHSYIRSIKIPSTLKFIGKNAFKLNAVQTLDLSKCKDLELAEEAFAYTINLRQITLPSTLKYIPKSCFYMSTRIRDFTIPKSVTYIDDSAFASCFRLRKVEIEDNSSLFSIGDGAFAECFSLETITLPKTFKSIGNNMFSRCYDLSSVIFQAANTWNVHQHGGEPVDTFTPKLDDPKYNAKQLLKYANDDHYLISQAEQFNNLKYLTNDNDKCVIIGWTDDTVTDITIPATISSTNQITNQNQEYKVIGISNNAFAGNNQITTVTFEKDTTTGLSNIEYILNNAFSGCKNLTTINNLPFCKSLNYIGDYAFKQCFLKDNPQPADLITFDLSKLPITYIGREAFEGVVEEEANETQSLIKSITLPTAITFLGAGAFKGLVNLDELKFTGCSALESIGRYKDATELEAIPLISTTKDITIDLLDCTSLTYLPSCLFAGVSKLSSITLPNSILGIYDYAFQNCTSLTKITIPDDCVLIRQQTFENCQLQEVTLQKGSKWDLYSGSQAEEYTSIGKTEDAQKIKTTTEYTWIKQLI